MDVKIEYQFANRYQIEETYLRFFERRFISTDNPNPNPTNSDVNPTPSAPELSGLHAGKADEAPLSEEEARVLAQRFADVIPENMFALAQVQGYLLTKKMEPRGAVDGAQEWVDKEIEDRRKLEELKEARRAKRKERKEAAQGDQAETKVSPPVPSQAAQLQMMQGLVRARSSGRSMPMPMTPSTFAYN